jgi:hypothetical protein
MTESDFYTWIRVAKGPQDSIKLAVLRGDAHHELIVPLW